MIVAHRPHPADGPRARPGHERGAGTVLTIIVRLFISMASVMAFWFAGWVASRHTAAHAADLAALAGAQAQIRGLDPCRAARATALENGGRVISCRVQGGLRDFVILVTAESELHPVVPKGPRSVQMDAVAGSLRSR